MSLMRVLKTTQVTLTHVFTVDELATDASGNVVVTIKRLDGTTVESGNATRTTLGTYTYVFPPQADLDILSVDWVATVAGAPVTIRDIIEVVGGFIFEISAGRNAHKSLTNTVTYPTSLLAERRIAVEQECESISGQAWVPRFARFLVDGSGTSELIVPDYMIRAVRSASVITEGTSVAVNVSSLVPSEEGVIRRIDGDKWPYGFKNVLVEYEHGHDLPREDIRLAAIQRLRWLTTTPSGSGIPSRALSWTANEGGTYRLTTAGPRSTGEPDVDAAYLRDALEHFWIA